MKTCIGCKRAKPKAEFYKAKTKKDGLQNKCKACEKRYCQENAEKIAEYYKQYYQENAEKKAEYDKQYQQENAEKIAERKKQYYQENAEKIAEYMKQYQRERLKSDQMFKFIRNVRRMTAGAFKRSKTKKYRKDAKTWALIGCSPEEFYKHLAKQFLPGMSLDNHGEWHIDHVIPLASASTQAEIEALCHYTNLQPLWAEDNLKKGDKL